MLRPTLKPLSALLDNPTTVEGSRPQASKGLRTTTNQEQLRVPGTGAGRRTAARAMSKGGGRNPTIQGPPPPTRADGAASLLSDYPTPAERRTLLPVMRPLSQGLTLASPTGLGGVGSGVSQLSVQGPRHGSLGRVGAGPLRLLPSRQDQPRALARTPRTLEAKVRAVSTCANSQAGCSERECAAPRQAECGGQQVGPREPVKEVKASVILLKHLPFLHMSALHGDSRVLTTAPGMQALTAT